MPRTPEERREAARRAAETRRENAEHRRQEARLQAMMVGALRRTGPPPKPDVMSGEWNEYRAGWAFNLHRQDVYLAWTTGHSHGEGPPPLGERRYSAGSQDARPLHSTRLRALQALRCAVEDAYARHLACIDVNIEDAAEKADPETP